MRTKATWQEASLVWMRTAREEAVQDMRRAELEIDALKRIVASLDQLIPMREAEAAKAAEQKTPAVAVDNLQEAVNT